MQSKLPVRIKRKQLHVEKKKCCCAQLLQFMAENLVDSSCDERVSGSCTSKLFSAYTQCISRSTQTDNFHFNKDPYLDIKNILISVNGSLEHILHTLQEQKDLLYQRLYEESCMQSKNVKVTYSKNKIEKAKKKTMQVSNMYNANPEVTRQNYGYPLWLKQAMQRSAYNLSPTPSNLIICPKLCSRPLSCSDISYFQTIGRILHRKSLRVSIYPHPIFTVIGRGDSKFREENDSDDLDHQQTHSQETDLGVEKDAK